jgi:hypothetical protein
VHSPYSPALPYPVAPTHHSPSGLRLNVGLRDVGSVYLGGNITRNDWRRSVVSGLGHVGVAPTHTISSRDLWPILPAAVVGRFDYVGPYSLSGDPTDDAEWNSDHAEQAEDASEWVVTGALYGPQRGPRTSRDSYAGGQTQPSLIQSASAQEVWWPLVRSARQVKRLVVAALQACDLYFAWVDTPLCASTLSEVGLAAAQGKIIWIAGPAPFDELWLIYTMADQYSFRYATPAAAFQNMFQFALSTPF